MTARIMFVTRNVVVGRAMRRVGADFLFVTFLPPLVMSRMCLSGRTVPRFGKIV